LTKIKATLAGAPRPQTESRCGFEIDAVQFKMRLDFGLGCSTGAHGRGWLTQRADAA